MHTAPTARLTLARSRMQGAFVSIVTIILVAITLYSVRASGLFSSQTALLAGLGLLALAGLGWDLLQQPGARELRYTQGIWSLQTDDQQLHGTLQVHLDLPGYVLARWTGDRLMSADQTRAEALKEPDDFTNKLFPSRRAASCWLHLERRMATSDDDWLALCRAFGAVPLVRGGVIDSGTAGYVQPSPHEHTPRSS